MKRKVKIILLLAVICSLGFAVYVGLEKSDRRLLVAFLDVGQGDAIFIRSPSGKQMLIDGGPSGAVLLRELGEVMPFYDRSIDYVLMTHPDQDHIAGLNFVLDRFRVGMFIRTVATSGTAAFNSLMSKVQESEVVEIIITDPQLVSFEDGVEFQILFPDQNVSGWETNDSSIVGRLEYGRTSVLLTGDSPAHIEKHLVQKYGDSLQSDVLKAGHHGSKYSSSREFVEIVAPEYAVFSAGIKNRYGHPNQEVIETLNSLGIKILGTLGRGAVKFWSDGEKFTL